MKKNGFTLVELLAVIAILAILVAMVMPNVMEEYNKAKANVFVTDAQSFMNAATSKFTSDALSNAGKTIYYSSKHNSDLNTSKLNIESNKEYFIEMDRHGNIKRFVLYDETYCYDIFTTYGESSIGELEGTNAYNNNGEPISKTVIDSKAVWDSGNDSVDIVVTKNGDKIESYFVKGCEAKSHSYDDDIEADSNVTSLYGVLQKEAKKGTLAKKYTGSHKDSYNRSATHDIYHFHADNDEEATSILNKNNVLFANHCWKMIRTTDTGGVKLLYNGEVDSVGKCGTDRPKHLGYEEFSYGATSFGSFYYFSDDYTYDSSTKKFTLTGNIVYKKWNDSSYQSLIGKYTCRSASTTCNKLYLVESYIDSEHANVYYIDDSVEYDSIGVTYFNLNNNSLGSVGYMYGESYLGDQINMSNSVYFESSYKFFDTKAISTSLWYSDSIQYINGKYELVNPYQVSSEEDLYNLVEKYTLASDDKNLKADNAYYITEVSDNYITGEFMYYFKLENGKLLSDVSPVVFGDSYIKNADGLYTLSNASYVELKDILTSLSSYKGKYISNSTSNICDTPRYIVDVLSSEYDYINVGEQIRISKSRNNLSLVDSILVNKADLVKNRDIYSDYKYTCGNMDSVCSNSSLQMVKSYYSSSYVSIPNYIFAKSIKYENGKYKLINTTTIENNLDTNFLKDYHFVCLEKGVTECSNVAYVFYITSSLYKYILLKNGAVNVVDVYNSMLKNNVNDSIVKKAIDMWYEDNLIDYADYLEETIYCNSRNAINFENSGWNSNGGLSTNKLNFDSNYSNFDLYCVNQTDQFSVSNLSAKLKYSIGLPTLSEINLANMKKVFGANDRYYTMSPSSFDYYSSEYVVYGYGGASVAPVNSFVKIRPTISLKMGIEFTSGDGSTDSPYVVE